MALTKALQETLNALIELGEATAKEIADKLGVSVSGIRKRLSKLVDEGLVEKVQEGRTVKFKASNVSEETVDERNDEEVENESTEIVAEENENNEVENAASDEDEDEDDLVDIYINGKYTISVEEDRVDEVVKRCNPNAVFERKEGNKYFYVVKSGDKG